MNNKRQQAYLTLIQKLLACSHDQELEILMGNINLLDMLFGND
ncbi:hypothetical protein [Coleofasciculus sp. F4-SAH-05]